MKQQKEKKDMQGSMEWSQNVSSMNLTTLKVLHLIKEYQKYNGKWQENKEPKED